MCVWKVKAMHYMSDYIAKDGDQSYKLLLAFSAKRKLTITDRITGAGKLSLPVQSRK